jgi:signal transduction histidine kinase
MQCRGQWEIAGFPVGRLGDTPSEGIISGDRIQLQQVILNLLRNASEAMIDVHDRARHLLIRTERGEGDRVRVTVRDTGVGLERENTDRLFDTFFTTKSEGMGVRLSISRSIIERHRGRLRAESNDGPGATFTLSLPRGTENALEASPATTTS